MSPLAHLVEPRLQLTSGVPQGLYLEPQLAKSLLGVLQRAARRFNIRAGRFRGLVSVPDAPFDFRPPLLRSSVLIQFLLMNGNAIPGKSVGFQTLDASLVFLLQKAEGCRFLRLLTPRSRDWTSRLPDRSSMFSNAR